MQLNYIYKLQANKMNDNDDNDNDAEAVNDRRSGRSFRFLFAFL